MRLAAAWAARVISEHRGVRRTLLAVLTLLNGWISWQVFKDITKITGAAAAAYATAAGLLNAPLLFYFHHRHQDEQ